MRLTKTINRRDWRGADSMKAQGQLKDIPVEQNILWQYATKLVFEYKSPNVLPRDKTCTFVEGQRLDAVSWRKLILHKSRVSAC